MKVLFVTRKYPPSVGGMENLSYHLAAEMQQRVQLEAITWGGSQKLLPFFVLYALARSIWVGMRGVDLVHLGDAVVSVIGWLMKRIFRVPVVVAVHGLDVTFTPRLYQWLIPRLLNSLDVIVCNSAATRDACVARGVAASKCVVICPGVSVPLDLPTRDSSRRWLAMLLTHDLQNALVLLTVGRLVPRKGVAWFIESVLPQVVEKRPDVCYLVVGSGPDEQRIRSTVARLGLEGHVSVLGRIPAESLACLYTAADLFVMPNVPRPGDMEGFGLVALEAAAHGLPVVAADLDGVRDAVLLGRTGYLLKSGDAESWGATVLQLLADQSTLKDLGVQARAAAQAQCTWSKMADQYESLFHDLASENSR